MNALLSRALGRKNLNHMAVRVLETSDESPEAVASTMADQVEKEVAERIAVHPLIVQCEALGIKTPTDLSRWHDEALLGRSYLAELRADAKAQANRAFDDPETALMVGAQVDHLPAAQVKKLLNAWSAQADSMYGIGMTAEQYAAQLAQGNTRKPTGGAVRMSAPTSNPESLSATGSSDSKNQTPWQQLTEDRRAFGLKIGMNTPEKQDAWAKQILAEQAA